MKLRYYLQRLFAALLLTLILWVILHFIFEVDFFERWLNIIFLCNYFIIVLLFRAFGEDGKEDKEKRNWPISGPIAKFGSYGLMVVSYGTGLLAIFNPFQLFQMIKQGVGNFLLSSDKSQLVDNANDYRNKNEYVLPFEKNIEWLVFNGGINKCSSHSWDIITQRYAYDFVIVNDTFGRHENKGTNVEDYYCYKQNILAAADGIVVKVVNNIATAPFVGYGILDVFARSFIGNHVVIKHKGDEYSLYAHLVRGSVNLQKGERISQGEFVGKCGHSGYSSEPHLHFHLQDKPDFFFAKGLPIRFSKLKINGELSNKSYISATDQVENI